MVRAIRDQFSGQIPERVRVLDCGMGTGLIARSICCEFEPEAVTQRRPPSQFALTGLEIFAPYVLNVRLRQRIGPTYYWLYESICLGKEGDFVGWLEHAPERSYAFVIFGDSLEHVPPELAEHSLAHALRVASHGVIVN